MLPEENELRRQLAHRSFRSAGEVWPAVRRKLDKEDPRGRAAAWPAILAVLLVIVLLAALRGRSAKVEHGLPAGDFVVTDVRSRGRPTTPIVLRPDSKTLMVIVD